MWQKEPFEFDLNWLGAIEYCNNLEVGGFRNWKLPAMDDYPHNKSEVLSGMDKAHYGRSEQFWTHSEVDSSAWTADFSALTQDLFELKDKSWEYRVRCVRGSSQAKGHSEHAKLKDEERKRKNSFPFSDVQCQFTLLRPQQGYSGNPVDEKIAEGSIHIIDDQVRFTGEWLTGGDATPESFTNAKITIDDSGRLSGEMTAYHMFTSWWEKSEKPVHVILSRTSEKLTLEKTVNAFRFPMGRMVGALSFSLCSR